MTVNDFCKKYGNRYRKHIKAFYEAGYLGDTTYDKKSRKYHIQDDIPAPHIANSRIKDARKLLIDLLDAASHFHSVSPKMYPCIPENEVSSRINELADKGFLEIKTTAGVQYLSISDEGQKRFEELSDAPKNERVKIVGRWIEGIGIPFAKVAGEGLATYQKSIKTA